MELIKRLNGQIIRFNNNDWMIITKVKKEEIYNNEKHSKAFF